MESYELKHIQNYADSIIDELKRENISAIRSYIGLSIKEKDYITHNKIISCILKDNFHKSKFFRGSWLFKLSHIKENELKRAANLKELISETKN